MDVMGGVLLLDGTERKAITGIDDHSRFCVIATLVARATARPVCDALLQALSRHRVPKQILTDNGKVFTGRPARKPATVAFDRICLSNGIRHLLTPTRPRPPARSSGCSPSSHRPRSSTPTMRSIRSPEDREDRRPSGGPGRAHQHPQAPLPRRTSPRRSEGRRGVDRRAAPRDPPRGPRRQACTPAPARG
jgi:Integrase core domain